MGDFREVFRERCGGGLSVVDRLCSLLTTSNMVSAWTTLGRLRRAPSCWAIALFAVAGWVGVACEAGVWGFVNVLCVECVGVY